MKDYNDMTTYEAYKLGYKKGYEEGKNCIKDIIALAGFSFGMWLFLVLAGIM